ncbi:hypothetical protein L596_006079 [Steinernema carpocapsae]|uniref:Uncharacterized protein n=1 Tax=Steinernema carpocapsae TaxID=34508 RepID=A0A4U8V834_STECR|nr:hypothetical protein L596_006079 [Steinernema carpocapsae]
MKCEVDARIDNELVEIKCRNHLSKNSSTLVHDLKSCIKAHLGMNKCMITSGVLARHIAMGLVDRPRTPRISYVSGHVGDKVLSSARICWRVGKKLKELMGNNGVREVTLKKNKDEPWIYFGKHIDNRGLEIPDEFMPYELLI